MSRVDEPELYDPFGWRLAELADPLTSADRRVELLEELLVWEAAEIAHGYRHLTVVHGDPDDLGESRRLDVFDDALRSVSDRCASVRVRGETGFLTVTVGGAAADDRIAAFTKVAQAANPGGWVVVDTAFPPVPEGSAPAR